MDRLLLNDCDHHHYDLITDLVKIVCYVRGLDYRFSYKNCRNCFGFVEKVLKITTYISVTVAKMQQLSFICLQVRTTHTSSRTWLLRGLSLLISSLTSSRSYDKCLFARDQMIKPLHKSRRYLNCVALR